MPQQYHILNGDALKDQFPIEISQNIIVARECLVDGDITSKSLTNLYKIRARFIATLNEDFNKEYYYKHSVSEFDKIKKIDEKSEINLWLEDDLFCQVNFWFILYLIKKSELKNKLFLVRPNVDLQFGFGGMSKDALNKAYKNRVEIDGKDFDLLSSFWPMHQNNKNEIMLNTAEKLNDNYPYLRKVIQANIQRQPNENSLGRPTESLKQIIKDLSTNDFASIFKEFSKRESIYGYGDLQVKRLVNELLKQEYKNES